MLRFEEALNAIRNLSYMPATEKVDLPSALHRVLAEDVRADMDMPPFDKSAMDGFACRREDLGMPLKITGTIAAGQDSGLTVSKGECVRIMTGARVPPGSDCVIMLEDTETSAGGHVIFRAAKTSANICAMGEDVRTGELLVKKGTLLEPRHMPALAGMGYPAPEVYVQPSTGIFVTGDELVSPDRKPSATQIRNSNGPQLEAQLRAMHIMVKNYGIVPDSRELLRETFNLAVTENTMTIVCGGVSVGDFDFMPGIINEAGFNIHFHGMRAKPGKRTLFAVKDNKFVFGLPGNPVSSLVVFELLVKPLLMNLQGSSALPVMEEVVLKTEYRVKNNDRTSFIPVIIHADGTALPVEYHGSAHIFAYASANGIMEIPEGVSKLKEGQKINVRRL